MKASSREALGLQRELWDSRKDAYPFRCRATIGLHPANIPNTGGFSAVLTPGIRTWGFKSPEELEKFKHLYEEYLR